MQAPKVSVLMPIYNTKEKFLREAIQSILSQTYKDFEFLILNDSPENTKLDKIVNSYKDKRIKYIKNKQNIGISKSRNKLIDLAKGKYLAVMDHDDISLPERLEKQVQYLEQHSDVGVVGTKTKTIIKNKTSKNPTDNHNIKLALLRNCAVLHPSSMIRKSVLIDNHICYEEEFSPAEDYALWCRLILHTNFHNLNDEVLFYYRDHKENTSHQQREKMHRATYNIWSFVENENPKLYKEFLIKATHVKRIRLFGFIPLLTIKKQANRTRVYLFEKILLYTTKCTSKL